MDNTLKYYNKNANQFVQGTLSVDVVPDVMQSIFLRMVVRWMPQMVQKNFAKLLAIIPG